MGAKRQVVALKFVALRVYNLNYRVLVLILRVYDNSVYVVGEVIKLFGLECLTLNQLIGFVTFAALIFFKTSNPLTFASGFVAVGKIAPQPI